MIHITEHALDGTNTTPATKLMRRRGLCAIGLLCAPNDPRHACSDALAMRHNPPIAHHVKAEVPWKRNACLCLCSEMTLLRMFRITSGSTASYKSAATRIATARSCLFAQISIGRSSKSGFEARSPTGQEEREARLSSSFTSLNRSGSLLSIRNITP